MFCVDVEIKFFTAVEEHIMCVSEEKGVRVGTYLDLRWQFKIYVMRNTLSIYQILFVINLGREKR
jgi:hypothetical protein